MAGRRPDSVYLTPLWLVTTTIGNVILSAAKNPRVTSEILRCAQHDRQPPFLIGNIH